jgi:hypothetical protein
MLGTDQSGNVLGWETTDIRFHYPTEHKIQGVDADVEVQIFYKLQNEFMGISDMNVAAVSFLFSSDDSNSPSFFDQIDFEAQGSFIFNLE